MNIMRVISSFLVIIWIGSAAQAETPEVFFQDLADPAALAFEDPFEEMGFALLQELRTIVRLESQLKQRGMDAGTRARLEIRMSGARSLLNDAGYDAETLIAQRWRVAEQRKQARIATNPDLPGSKIKISGFLIPAGRDSNGTQLGYLVPEIGMCSHKPPPPPNQLLRVRLEPSTTLNGSIYHPAEVTGVVEPVDSDETIFLLDGDVRMVSRWTLVAEKVEPRANVAEFSLLNPLMQARRRATAGQSQNAIK